MSQHVTIWKRGGGLPIYSSKYGSYWKTYALLILLQLSITVQDKITEPVTYLCPTIGVSNSTDRGRPLLHVYMHVNRKYLGHKKIYLSTANGA